ncbi:MAG: amidohydrolase [Bacteroidia bacterium]
MNKIYALILLSLTLLFSCKSIEKADHLYYNAQVHTLDSVNAIYNAFVVNEGKILAFGEVNLLEKQFLISNKTDLKGAHVYPGLIDAHCHFYGLGLFLQQADLSGSKSIEEIVSRCIKFSSNSTLKFIRGRGWDQNLFDSKEFPDNSALNAAFPDIPVFLKRVDGHAAIANDYLLNLAGLNSKSKISGGEIILKNGKLTGVLLDEAADYVGGFMPQLTYAEKVSALMKAQEQCFTYGLSTVNDAGLDKDIVELIDSLQIAGKLKIRMNAMLSISRKHFSYLDSLGGIDKDRLKVRSFKMYGDGALGSRGACLKEHYTDRKGHFGFMISSPDSLEAMVNLIANSRFQLNTHCIGDSANFLILSLYNKYLPAGNDRRWRIEHAQVVNPADRDLFKARNIIPSVQPTHATSDMYWAESRLGYTRLNGAYSYASLLKQNNWLPLGTDFPVEDVSPFFTFDAAVSRKDAKGFPLNGFLPEQALSREQALKGMTIWAAKAGFMDNEVGSLELNKKADFIILDVDLLKDDLLKIRNQKAKYLYISGERVK